MLFISFRHFRAVRAARKAGVEPQLRGAVSKDGGCRYEIIAFTFPMHPCVIPFFVHAASAACVELLPGGCHLRSRVLHNSQDCCVRSWSKVFAAHFQEA